MLCQLKALGATPESNGQSGGCNQMLKHGKFLDILSGIQGLTLLVSFETGSFCKLCCVASLSPRHFLLSAFYPVNTSTQCCSCFLPARGSDFGRNSPALLPRSPRPPGALLPGSDFLTPSSFQIPISNPNLLMGCWTQMLSFGLWTWDCILLYLHSHS